MKKWNIFLFGSFVMFCVLLQAGGAMGWANRNHYNSAVEPYTSWQSYDYDREFGTHDWLALEALELVKAHTGLKWLDQDGKSFWTAKRQKIFLYATEGPDNSRISFSRQDGTIVNFPADKHFHHIYFNDDGSTVDIPAADRTDDFANDARIALLNGDCDLAAYYMGEMSHYIADLSCFEHVVLGGLSNNDHGLLESFVSERTDNQQGTNGRGSFDESFRYECFLIDDWAVVNGVIPSQIAIEVARYTRFADGGSATPDVMGSLFNNYFRSATNWPSSRSEWHDDWYEGDTVDQYKSAFMFQLEVCLEWAACGIADSMNWVVDQYYEETTRTYIQCALGADNGITRQVQKSIMHFSFLMLFSLIGFLSTIIATQIPNNPVLQMSIMLSIF